MWSPRIHSRSFRITGACVPVAVSSSMTQRYRPVQGSRHSPLPETGGPNTSRRAGRGSPVRVRIPWSRSGQSSHRRVSAARA